MSDGSPRSHGGYISCLKPTCREYSKNQPQRLRCLQGSYLLRWVLALGPPSVLPPPETRLRLCSGPEGCRGAWRLMLGRRGPVEGARREGWPRWNWGRASLGREQRHPREHHTKRSCDGNALYRLDVGILGCRFGCHPVLQCSNIHRMSSDSILTLLKVSAP